MGRASGYNLTARAPRTTEERTIKYKVLSTVEKTEAVTTLWELPNVEPNCFPSLSRFFLSELLASVGPGEFPRKTAPTAPENPRPMAGFRGVHFTPTSCASRFRAVEDIILPSSSSRPFASANNPATRLITVARCKLLPGRLSTIRLYPEVTIHIPPSL